MFCKRVKTLNQRYNFLLCSAHEWDRFILTCSSDANIAKIPLLSEGLKHLASLVPKLKIKLLYFLQGPAKHRKGRQRTY